MIISNPYLRMNGINCRRNLKAENKEIKNDKHPAFDLQRSMTGWGKLCFNTGFFL